MLDLLASLADTPVPNVLVISGIVFLLLAVAGKIGANLSVPAQRQKSAATIGVVLLVSGIALFAVPRSSPESIDQPLVDEERRMPKAEHLPQAQPSPVQNPKPASAVVKPAPPDSQTVRAAIETTIDFAASEEVRAKYWLDLSVVESVYTGEMLRVFRSNLDNNKRNNEFQNCAYPTRQIHSIELDDDGSRATVDMTENWNCAFYSVETGNCLGQYVHPSNTRQTVYLEQTTSGWMISNIRFSEDNPDIDIVACSDAWPNNLQRK